MKLPIDCSRPVVCTALKTWVKGILEQYSANAHLFLDYPLLPRLVIFAVVEIVFLSVGSKAYGAHDEFPAS